MFLILYSYSIGTNKMIDSSIASKHFFIYYDDYMVAHPLNLNDSGHRYRAEKTLYKIMPGGNHLTPSETIVRTRM